MFLKTLPLSTKLALTASAEVLMLAVFPFGAKKQHTETRRFGLSSHVVIQKIWFEHNSLRYFVRCLIFVPPYLICTGE